MRKLLFFVTFVIMIGVFYSCQKEDTIVETPTATTPTYTSRNPSGSPDVLRSTGLKYVGILKKLSDNPEFRHIVKNHYECHVGDTLFDYTVRLLELRESSPMEFDNVLRETLTSTEYTFVMNTIDGFTSGSITYYPTLFNFYYAPEFRGIAEWDGDGITEVVFNYDVGGKFYGYGIDGSVVEYTDIDGRLLNSGKWIFEWEKEGGVQERPWLEKCYCQNDPSKDHPDPCCPMQGPTSKRFCGFGNKKIGCIGFCRRNFPFD